MNSDMQHSGTHVDWQSDSVDVQTCIPRFSRRSMHSIADLKGVDIVARSVSAILVFTFH
jgi:hypothetical protein